MAKYTVYLDQVFLGSLVMNYAILWAAAKLSRTPVSKGRLAAGSAVGALYSLALFVPGDTFLLSVWFKVAASVIIAATTFAPLPPKKFFTCLGCLYLASFALGGLTFGVIFFIHSGQITGFNGVSRVVAGHFWPGVILGLVAFWAAIKGVAVFFKTGIFEALFKMPLFIRLGSVQVRTKALLDSGNELKDPITGNPVVVVEYGAVRSILPAEVQAGFEKGGEPDVWEILSSLSESDCALRFSAIPFHSLGHAGGLMVGFRPDEVLVERQGRQESVGKVVLAICHRKLDPAGTYHALLGREIIESVN